MKDPCTKTIEAVLNAAEEIERKVRAHSGDVAASGLSEAISMLRCHPLNDGIEKEWRRLHGE